MAVDGIVCDRCKVDFTEMKSFEKMHYLERLAAEMLQDNAAFLRGIENEVKIEFYIDRVQSKMNAVAK